MRKALLAVALALLLIYPLAAQSAKVVRMDGKVELQRPGGAWSAATVGQEFPLGTTISTGFRSTAVLQVGSSQITVLALTRMSVSELAESQTSVTTTLNLQTGKVRAEVRPAPGQVADFKLRSPVSTAAVRGTDFYFNGYRTDVIEGVVELLNLLGQSQFVTAGNGSQTTGNDAPSYPEDSRGGGQGAGVDFGLGGGGGGGVGTSGSLTIVIEPPATD